jgi:predicted molibdopterin-dependent oxidoreductase YjgC
MPALMEVQVGSDTTQRSPAAERMRLHRERKKNGMRCFMIELRETEIDALIRKGFLKSDTRNDTQAIIDALYSYFDREFT